MNQPVINFCCVILLTLSFGQGQTELPSDFATLQKLSVEEVGLKTQAHKEAWGFGKFDRWDLNQDTGQLMFSFPDGINFIEADAALPEAQERSTSSISFKKLGEKNEF